MSFFLESDRLSFRGLQYDDIDNGYFNWLNDPLILDQLESRYFPNSKEALQDFIKSYANSKNNLLLAIICKASNKYIGNIKLGPINWIHRFGDIGIIIGDKEEWGKGYAAEAIRCITDFAFSTLNLHKITAGAYQENIGSIKAFQKVGFKIEGEEKDQYFYHGRYTTIVRMGLIKKDDANLG